MKRLFLFIVIVAGFGVAIWFGGRAYFSRSVASYSGEVSLAGLGAGVEVSFDARGIPRVRAGSDADLFFAIGYLHASERLFQMELVRRLAGGELAEIFGVEAYEGDVRQRRLGFARKARADAAGLSPRARAALDRYVSGINAWIGGADPLPPEFILLRFEPRPWTVEDCLSVAVYQTWYSHELMASDEAYETLLRVVGPWIEETLEAPYPWSVPTVMTPPISEEPFPLRASQASNSWAISPARSSSGAALHAADPHLSINRAPGLWYVASLHSLEGLEAAGVMQPGLPLVVMGHNGRISYAFTVASVDIVDTYEEELMDGTPAMVMTSAGPVELETFPERIMVKGEKAARHFTVEVTPNGPLIQREPGRGVSLHWAGYDFSVAGMIDAGLDLMAASGFEEFRGIVTRFGALDAGWIYADRAGNVAFQLGVPIPIRSYDNTFTRQDGKAETAAWLGYVPLEETPWVLNPPEGWVASCNNRPVGDDRYPIPGFYDPYRITRAASLLDAREHWTQVTAGEPQLDLVSGRSLRWKNLAADSADAAGLAELAASLRAWDGEMSPDSREAAVFAVWWQKTGKLLFHDELGDEWRAARTIQEHVLSGNAAQLVDDRRTPEVETLLDVAGVAMSAAVAVTKGRTYGELSTLRVSHPLARVRLVDEWLGLSRGPVPFGGDLGSLAANFNRFDEEKGTFAAGVGPSMRFVLDWADPDAFTIDIAFGQSGNPMSPHYDDFFAASLAGERWNLPFSKEKQDANEASRLRLVP
jgi:penicillin amidase